MKAAALSNTPPTTSIQSHAPKSSNHLGKNIAIGFGEGVLAYSISIVFGIGFCVISEPIKAAFTKLLNTSGMDGAAIRLLIGMSIGTLSTIYATRSCLPNHFLSKVRNAVAMLGFATAVHATTRNTYKT